MTVTASLQMISIQEQLQLQFLRRRQLVAMGGCGIIVLHRQKANPYAGYEPERSQGGRAVR